MDLQKIAKILYNLSLDMDYADSLEYKDEEVKCITEELEILKTKWMFQYAANVGNDCIEKWRYGTLERGKIVCH